MLHTVVMLLLFHGTYWEILSAGLFNTIDETTSPLWAAAFWTLQFGFMLILIGLLLPADREPVRKQFGIGLFLLIALGIIVMPASGFWLGLPVAIGVLQRG